MYSPSSCLVASFSYVHQSVLLNQQRLSSWKVILLLDCCIFPCAHHRYGFVTPALSDWDDSCPPAWHHLRWHIWSPAQVSSPLWSFPDALKVHSSLYVSLVLHLWPHQKSYLTLPWLFMYLLVSSDRRLRSGTISYLLHYLVHLLLLFNLATSLCLPSPLLLPKSTPSIPSHLEHCTSVLMGRFASALVPLTIHFLHSSEGDQIKSQIRCA